MKRIKLLCGFFVLAAMLTACKPEPIELSTVPKDVDGNVYDTVRIGNQTWMSQDLQVLHLPNGLALQPFGIRQEEPAYTTYGGKTLYNSMAAQYGASNSSAHVQGICPNGWHLPSSAEWQELIDYVNDHPGTWNISGTVSHALANQVWGYETHANDNQTGFSAEPTGYVHSYDSHSDIGDNRWEGRKEAFYWSADHNDYYPRPYNAPDPTPWILPQWGVYGTDSLQTQSFVFKLNLNHELPEISSLPDIHYCAVRCVKD